MNTRTLNWRGAVRDLALGTQSIMARLTFEYLTTKRDLEEVQNLGADRGGAGSDHFDVPA